MRPPQLLWLLLCFMAFPLFLTVLSLSNAHTQVSEPTAAGYSNKSSRLRTLFSFRTPVSLFPPSAVISLTDDNSTFFLARPAAFGPPLPSHGLSSALWVGSGFGDEIRRKFQSAFGPEGELGCSDVPGWAEGDESPGGKKFPNLKQPKSAVPDKPGKDPVGDDINNRKTRRAVEKDDPDNLIRDSIQVESSPQDDGTDDHLHHPLSESNPAGPATPGQPADHEITSDKSKLPTHADIQSLQESAEIAGKIVLLSRGGCGFLEKVKWVQRRGGVGLIVGDDARGGPLITMYARGDTSNVTIPALFTSHTTAHLLSSLIPSRMQDEQADGAKEMKSTKANQRAETSDDRPTFTAKAAARSTTRPQRLNVKDTGDRSEGKDKALPRSRFARFFSRFNGEHGANHPRRVAEDSRRPPSSGNLDWILLEDWDESRPPTKSGKTPAQKSPLDSKPAGVAPDSPKTRPSSKSSDDFVIGVQDWRDPDVLAPPDKQDASKTISTSFAFGRDPSRTTESSKQATSKPHRAQTLKGGSITPGSGEYGNANNGGQRNPKPRPLEQSSSGGTHDDGLSSGTGRGWTDLLRWTKSPHPAEFERTPAEAGKPLAKDAFGDRRAREHVRPGGEETTDEHEGLWVTLTPATMSTSPFFDTLLVLVVSPLVTLTVVYALLVLRSRIRRRRWRAPKSVVDRLPIRIYHTMSNSSSTTSSQTTTPPSSSPTSPLLRSTSRTANSRNRPRSQTTSGVIPPTDSSSNRSSTSPLPAKEKMTGAPVWRRRYTGRQIECCVCLDEYVDGQSRIMSLPCGHEFHADCITPWLVTRRRTCPICKGDVVKSMAHGSSNERRQEGESRSDDIQSRAAETVNETRSAAIPIPPHMSLEDEEDLEQGTDASAPLVGGSNAPRSGWRNLTPLNLLALSGDTAVWRSSSVDRNR